MLWENVAMKFFGKGIFHTILGVSIAVNETVIVKLLRPAYFYGY